MFKTVLLSAVIAANAHAAPIEYTGQHNEVYSSNRGCQLITKGQGESMMIADIGTVNLVYFTHAPAHDVLRPILVVKSDKGTTEVLLSVKGDMIVKPFDSLDSLVDFIGIVADPTIKSMTIDDQPVHPLDDDNARRALGQCIYNFTKGN